MTRVYQAQETPHFTPSQVVSYTEEDPLAKDALSVQKAVGQVHLNPIKHVVDLHMLAEKASTQRIRDAHREILTIKEDLSIFSKLNAALQKLGTEKSSYPLDNQLQSLLSAAKERGHDLFVDGQPSKLSKSELTALKERLKDLTEDLKPRMSEIMNTRIMTEMESSKRMSDIVKKMLEHHSDFMSKVSARMIR